MSRGQLNSSGNSNPHQTQAADSTGRMVFYPNPTHSHHGGMDYSGEHMGHMGHMQYFETPQGRLALPMQGGPQVVMMNPARRYTPSPVPTDEEMFEPMEEGAPAPQLRFGSHSPPHPYASLRPHPHPLVHPSASPTDAMRQHQAQQQLYYQQQQIQQQHQLMAQQQQLQQRNRPPVARTHSVQAIQPMPRPIMQRQHSLQVPGTRSASPQIVGDVFDAPSHVSPAPRPNSSLGLEMVQHSVPDPVDMYFGNQAQGITPSRALGPPPSNPFSFASNRGEAMITPNDKRSSREEPSSAATSLTATSSSSLTDLCDGRGSGRLSYQASDDEENDSPTRGAGAARLRQTESDAKGPSRMTRPPPRPTVIGGRTSNRFAQVAVDPGVEGCPPGPRPTERPSPSFACIIGQAILASKAGGLSLEHIYRYVETVYPYFKGVDGAWRNSVRHNLSIHKMFETIPRTEKFPPGKGGIWIIHEDEKLHWPSTDKFVKNFPTNHPHHAVCRQTLHEAEKERQAKEKAEAEGKIYVPKKAKKPKKGSVKEEEESVDMMRSASTQSDGLFAPVLSEQALKTITPTMMLASLPEELDTDEFVAMTSIPTSMPTRESSLERTSSQEPMSHNGTMAPPRFGVPEKRRSCDEDENFFNSSGLSSGVKRIRMTEGVPLKPIEPDYCQQFLQEDEFITPERDRFNQSSSTSKMAQSSTLKTPALVNTSSSPGSSPMPPTVPRGTHAPSALHQGWTHDDIESSPPCAPLGAALDIDIRPKSSWKPTADEDFLPMGPPPSGLAPKTPVTRSSAHSKPRTPLHCKTPGSVHYTYASPAMSFASSQLMSTPSWEMAGCLDRLGNCQESPDGSRDIARFALNADSSLNNGASPRKRQISAGTS